MAHHDVRAANRLHQLAVQRIGDRGSHATADGHADERGVKPVAIWQAEAQVRCTTGRVDLQFIAETFDDMHDLLTRRVDCADRHHQWIDNDIARRDAEIHGALDDFFRDRRNER